jgi:molybdopterin converting factor small subunit
VGRSSSPPGSSSITVRYFAGARAAAGGTSEETLEGRFDLTSLTEELARRHGTRLGTVMKAASFLVDGRTWHDQRVDLPDGATVDVLPPFAGG